MLFPSATLVNLAGSGAVLLAILAFSLVGALIFWGGANILLLLPNVGITITYNDGFGVSGVQ